MAKYFARALRTMHGPTCSFLLATALRLSHTRTAGIDDCIQTAAHKYQHNSKDRGRSFMEFHHRGHRICGTTFRMLHGIGIENLVLTQVNDFLIALFRQDALQQRKGQLLC